MKQKIRPKDMYRKDKQVALRITASDYAWLEYQAERRGTSPTFEALRYLQQGITAWLVSFPIEWDGYNEQHVKMWGEEFSLEYWKAALLDAKKRRGFTVHWTSLDPYEIMGQEEAEAAGFYRGSSDDYPEDGLFEVAGGKGIIGLTTVDPYTKQQKVILKKELQELRAQVEKMGEKIEILERVTVESEE